MGTSYFFQSIPGSKGALKTIIITACIVGAVDGLAAVLLTLGVYHRPPMFVFQYIASSLFGTAAFSGGFLTALTGLICHFLIALIWTVIFFMLHPAVSLLLRNKIAKCILYGVVIWTIMNLVVLPFTHVPGAAINPAQVLTGIAILIFAAGLPMVLRFDKYYSKNDF